MAKRSRRGQEETLVALQDFVGNGAVSLHMIASNGTILGANKAGLVTSRITPWLLKKNRPLLYHSRALVAEMDARG